MGFLFKRREKREKKQYIYMNRPVKYAIKSNTATLMPMFLCCVVVHIEICLLIIAKFFALVGYMKWKWNVRIPSELGVFTRSLDFE